ncbi:MAG: acyltransferase [Hydrogenophilales bacterium 28-61-23]|nr:MAG: acyltransferase [Hydrogenophilales bacterium 28-61-23]
MEWLAQRFELSRGGGAHNVRPMEGMRGFAVFLVFLVHYVTLIKPWISGEQTLLALAGAIHTIGNTGVDLFFVLSGYLIYGSLISRRQAFFRYMARRVERIYPTFVVVFAVYIALSFVFPAENKIPAPGAEGMLYVVQNLLLLPGLFPIEPMITVAWSLSYEMFYYLAIPFAIALFGLRERGIVWRVAFFLAVAAATAIYSAAYGGHVRLIMFVSGILLFEAIENRDIPTPSSFIGLLALASGLLLTLLPITGSSGFALKIGILFVAFFILGLACFRDPTAWLPRTFSWTPMRWLGNMSYSYYLLHGLALKAGFLALAIVLPIADQGAWLFWLLLPAMFALTLIPSALLFLTVERPFSLTPRRTKNLAASQKMPA